MKKLLSFIPFILVVSVFCNAQSVGIGTTSPNTSAMLDINSTTKGVLFPRLSTTQMYAISNPPTGLVVFNTAYNELYQYTGSGWSAMLNSKYWMRPISNRDIIANAVDSVAIGTSLATELLDVNGTTRVRGTLKADNHLSAGTISSQGTFTALGTAHVLGVLQAFNEVRINNSGATLQLQNSAVDKAFFQLSGEDLRFGVNSGNTTGNLIFRMNGTDRAMLTNAGNLGLGTASPSGKLDVRGRSYLNNGNSEALAIDGSNPYIQFYHAGTARFFMQQAGNNLTLSSVTGNTGRLILNADNVTIGQVTPATGYKLSIGGKAICTELKVQLQGSWPDYVFSDDYKLKPLNELKAFIEENKHLPNIPPARDLEKEGMEVGEMQRKMMEKIEELTLYILQMEEDMKSMKETISKLKNH